MSMKRALRVILAVGLFGLSFSGYLTYHELFGAVRAASCPAVGRPRTVLGYPACVYGFFMYLAIVVVALIGLGSRKATGGRAPAASELVNAR